MPPKDIYIKYPTIDDMRTVDYPYDYKHLFYIDVPTTKWNSLVLYHIFQCLGIKNLADYIWDPTECGVLYIIKHGEVYKSICRLNEFYDKETTFHPGIHIKESLQNVKEYLKGLHKCSIIVGMDNWVQMVSYNGQLFNKESVERDTKNTTLINAMISGFGNYCASLNYDVITTPAKNIAEMADLKNSKFDWANWISEAGRICKTNEGDECRIHSTKDIFRYITINVSANRVYIESCLTSATMEASTEKYIMVGRRHGVGYELVDYPDTPAIKGYTCCPGKCIECKFLRTYEDSLRMEPEINNGISKPIIHREYIFECAAEKVMHSVNVPSEGGFDRCGRCILPGEGLKTDKKLVYNNAEESSEANKSNLQTKKLSNSMATTTKKSMFDRMLDKYMGQYKPNKVEGLSMTMDGNIALASGDDEFSAIVNDHIEKYPAEAIMPDIPFYSIQRPADQIKEGDYVFLNDTAEGRKLAKVIEVHTNKSGRVTALEVMRFNGTTDVTTVTVDKLTGITNMEVVLNMFDGSFMNMGQGNNPMMLMAMMSMMKDGKMDFEKMFMMSMMMGGNNPFSGMLNMSTTPANNPMMLMTMMSMFSGGKEMDFGKMWMMSAMMGGNNPFQTMFQPAAPASTPTRKTRSDKGTTKKPKTAPDGDGQGDPDPDAGHDAE